MLTQLLSELKTDLTLPKCLQIVGFLKRMQAFSTLELKLKFLQIRDNWFKEILAAILKNDPYHHLIKTIELTRVNLFNIITQYKALFDDESDTRDTATMIHLMFSSWIHEKVEDFLKTLEADLISSNCNLMDIGSVLGQCMYFGVSFSRIGVDFRAQCAPIFIKAISRYLNTSVIKATKQFENDMETFTLINKDIVPFKRHFKTNEDSMGSHDEKDYAPPESLLDFEPLALYCNALINIFNELKRVIQKSVLKIFLKCVFMPGSTTSSGLL